jgi:hypothetical protein
MVQPLNQPLNYTLNVPDPAAAVTSGLQQGVQLASMMERADLMAAQRRQTEIENRGLLAKQARATEFQQELGRLGTEGFSARGLNELMIKYPEAAEQLKSQYANLGAQEKQTRIDSMMPIVAAVNAGDNVSAQLEIEKQAMALENSGKTQEADAARRMITLLQQNPDAAKSTVNTAIASIMGPEKYAEVFGKLEDQRREQEVQPAKIAKAIAEGKIAEVKAQYQEQVEKAEIALKGAQTTQAKASAGASYASAKKTLREIQRIDALEPGEVRKLAAEAGKLEAEAAAKRGEGGAQSALEAGQRVLDTVKLLRGPAGDFGVLKDIAGPVASKMPTFAKSSADAERAIETVQSQVFLTQVGQMKGLGALTEKEGDRLVASIANLSLNQSPERLRRNLEYIEDTMKTAMDKARALGASSKPAAAAKPSPIALPGGFTYTPEGE